MPYDIVSFGETMLRLSPPQGVRLEQAKRLTSYVAGAESNTLACLARLGLKCAWLSALPSNPLGRRVASELRGHGVDIQRVLWLDGSERLGTYYAEEFRDPLGVRVYYDRSESACAHIDPAHVDLSAVDGTRLLHLTGITPALSARVYEVFVGLLRRACEQRVPISFDVNYRAKLWSAKQAVEGIEDTCRAASLLFCTRDDAADLWGFTGSPESVLCRIAERFDRNGDAKTTVLTLGSDGAAHLRGDEYCLAPAIPSDGQVRFGSGDAFAAGYIYATLEAPHVSTFIEDGHAVPLLLGNAAAALKRTIDGDIATIAIDEVTALLDMKSRGRFR
jgi:2-dehydro-3-deoxygluconokinase